jgi:hypothetical protein
MVVPGTADLVNLARRKTMQGRDASGDECLPYLLRTDCLRRCLPREGFPPCSTVYNIFRKFQRECSWEANDRNGATPGRWDGHPPTGQIDPQRPFASIDINAGPCPRGVVPAKEIKFSSGTWAA